MANGESMRLAKFLAAAGLGSRRKCEELIAEGRVSVNGKPVLTPACVVSPGVDAVLFEGRMLELADKQYVMLNKPVGYTCTSNDEHAEHLVFELLPETFGRLFYVGRLDRDSEGLLLFTNDGDMAQYLTHPSHQVEKTYVVDCDGVLTEARIRKMLSGVEDEGEFLRALKVTKMREKPGKVMFEVVLGEGHKREIRRMCAKVGLNVVRLARTKFAGIELGTLPTGEWRSLTDAEVTMLRKCMEKTAGGRAK